MTAAGLLDLEKPVGGVTSSLRFGLRVVAKPTKTDGSSFDESAGDCEVTARWGISGKGGICMPSSGRIAALLLLGLELNVNYRRVKGNAFPWQREG